MYQKPIRAVFLDIDNTLLSFTGYVRETMRKGFAKYGLRPYTEDMYQVFERENDHLWLQIEQGTLTFERLQQIRWNQIFRALGIDFDGPTFEHYFRDQLYESAIPEPGAIKLLSYLKERYLLCAASNGPYEQQVHRLMTGGMYGHFAHVFISERVGAQKPGKEFFDYCFRTLREKEFPDIAPEETVMIGDSMTSDIAGGAAYGMHTILYLRGKDPRQGMTVFKEDGKENKAGILRNSQTTHGGTAGQDGPEYAVRSLDEIREIL